MRLYYFTSQEFGLAAIKDKRLKIAQFDSLNDPFELLSIDLSDEGRKKSHVIGKKAVSRKYGIICLSASWQNPLLWGHYANKHTGICLGFDASDDAYRPVRYVSRRQTPIETEIIEYDIYRVKFKEWEYEQEYRKLCTLIDKDPVCELYFEQFQPDLTLKEVIIGCESNLPKERIIRALGGMKEDVKIVKTRPSVRDFKIVQDHTTDSW